MRNLKISLFLFLLSWSVFSSNSDLHDVNIFISKDSDIQKLVSNGIIPVDVDFGYVKTVISQTQIQKLSALGFKYFDNTAEDLNASRSGRASFPSLDNLVGEMVTLKNNYSSLTTIDTIGKSTSGRAILRMIITGSDDKIKPVYNITGTTHGNEKVGSEFVMDIANELLENYGSDNTCTEIVDNNIIQLVPMQCPDGYVSHSRYLSGSVDPNRQFGWQVGYNNGSDNHSSITFPFQHSELMSYYNNMNETNWYLCIDYHTGIKCIMAPWFADVGIGTALTDYTAFKTLGDMYLDEMPYDFTFQGKGLWMGGMESSGMPGVQTDWPYSRAGTLSLIVEASLSQSQTIPSDMATLAAGNLVAVKNMIMETQKGISGKITSKATGKPVFANVEVVGEGFPVLSSIYHGGFFKYVKSLSSSYSLKITANGYNDTTVNVSISSSNSFNNIDVALNSQKDESIYAMSMEYLRCYNRPSQSDMHNALGAPDNEGIALESQGGWNGSDGAMLLFFGENTPALDLDGDDITIYSTNSQTYNVYVGNGINDLDIDLGSGSGETSFDLAGKGVESVKFIKITCSNGDSPEIDAVKGRIVVEDVAIGSMQNIAEKVNVKSVQIKNNQCLISADLGISHYTMKLMDMKGRTLIKNTGFSKTKGISKIYSLDVNGISKGNYILKVNAGRINYTKNINLLN